MAYDTCPKCGKKVYIKYASKRACELLEALTQGTVKAKEVYWKLASGPIITDPERGGGLHICGEDKKDD